MLCLVACALSLITQTQQGRLLAEREPNNTPATAQPVAFGDSVAGAVPLVTDSLDYFAVDLAAGANLQVDIDTRAMGSPLNAWISILDRDGTTVLAEYADFVQHSVTVAGRYFVSVRRWVGDPWEPYLTHRYYLLRFSTFPAPGDPPRSIISGLTEPPWGLAMERAGAMYVVTRRFTGDDSDDTLAHVLRVDANGRVTTFATAYRLYGPIAVMRSGDVLVARGRSYTGETFSQILRISPTGDSTVFASSLGYVSDIRIGPDDEVWVGEHTYMASALHRYDVDGNRRQTIRGAGGHGMAFSPSGELHFVAGNGMFKVVNGAVVNVLRVDRTSLWGLAIDRDGYLYAGRGTTPQYGVIGRIVVVDPNYRMLHEPYALIHPLATVNQDYGFVFGFVLDASGNPTSRLLATSDDGIIEINTAGRGTPQPPPPPPLRIDSVPLPSASVQAAFMDTLRVLDAPGAVRWAVLAGRIPPGLALDSITGVVSGVPSETGYFRFAVRASSGSRSGVAGISIAVNHLTVVTWGHSAAVATPYADTLHVVERDATVTWSLTAGRLPPGIQLESSTGILAGVPVDSGRFSFTVRASSAQSSGTGDFFIFVSAAPSEVRDIAMAVLGAINAIPAALATALDVEGNNNGRLDVGDFRAYLRRTQRLPN